MKSLEQVLDENRVDLIDWPSTESELDEFLLDTDGCTLGMDSHDSRIADVLLRIDKEQQHIPASGQQWLFDVDEVSCDDKLEGSEREYSDFADIVRDAYLEVFDGYSIDRVIADPDRNSLFIQACWKRGAQASQADLNRQLMNARKAKKIGKVEGVKKYRVQRDIMDSYMFASEVALRLLQDIEHFSHSRWVTLDHILCEPTLGKKFVNIATSITPGHKPFDYRWAALSIRKALNRRSSKGSVKPMPHFDMLGSRDRLRASKVPNDAGLFWLKSGELDFYIGHSQHLRTQIEMLLDSKFEERLAQSHMQSLFVPQPVSFSIARLPDCSTLQRDGIKRHLVNSVEPRVNVTKRGGKAVA